MNTRRLTPLEISENEFMRIGHNLIDDIAKFNSSISERLVTQGKTPEDIPETIADKKAYLNQLNETLVTTLQNSGKLYVSNAIINEQYCMRACIVNFRTSKKDIEEIIDIIIEVAAEIHKSLIKETVS